jgi:hypothetical protein
MSELKRQDLYSLEEYAGVRPEFRAKVMEHKKNRQVHVGPNATLYFEDRLTMQYQVQEMLRAERIFEPAEIEDELAAYNPLIPDGRNWKATFMIEFPEVEERKEALAKMIGIEDKTWVQVDGHEKVYAIADEDLERDTEDKTSSVHFMRFELTEEMARDAKGGAGITVGIDHPAYAYTVETAPGARDALTADLD